MTYLEGRAGAAKQAAGETLNNFAKNFDSEVSLQSLFAHATSSLTIAQDPFYYHEPHQGQGEMSEKKKKKGRKFKNYKNGLMGSKMYQAPGVSAHDNAVLASVRRRSWHLDMSLFHWCGFRFGWSVIIGLVPV